MDQGIRNFLLMVTAIIIVVWVIYPIWVECEAFDNITIQPLVYEADKKLATSASEFVGMPDVILPPWGETNDKYGAADMIGGTMGIENPICSKACCAPQWPTSFDVPVDQITLNMKEPLVGTSYACNNSWQNSGCMCLTQNQSDFLLSRGGNTRLV